MIILSTTTDSLEIVLGSAMTTANMPFLACWRDRTRSSLVPGRTFGTTNGTTPVTMLSPPAADHQIFADLIIIRNEDTASKSVILRHNSNSTIYVLWSGSLSANESLVYTHRQGFRKLTSSGIPVDALSEETTVPDIQIFTSPGEHKWIKPTSFEPKLVSVVCIGAGGGGGGGMAWPRSTQYNGHGGGGGAYVFRMISAATLDASVKIIVGQGGAGGLGSGYSLLVSNVVQNSNKTGIMGELSAFGVFAVAYGGGGGGKGASYNDRGGGGGGTLGSGYNGSDNADPNYNGYGGYPGVPLWTQDRCGGGGGTCQYGQRAASSEYGGGAGGYRYTTESVLNGGSSIHGGGGGGAGGHVTSGSAYDGTNGGISGGFAGDHANNYGLSGYDAAPTAGGNGSNGSTKRAGYGGGGGGGGRMLPGASGGNGGNPGGGGGGGGASYYSSGGSGGKGGDGAVYVFCW